MKKILALILTGAIAFSALESANVVWAEDLQPQESAAVCYEVEDTEELVLGEGEELPIDISETGILIEDSVAFSGQNIIPELEIIYNEQLLVEGVDYTVAYYNNCNVGTAQAVITGIGQYSGTTSVTFQIVPVEANACTVSIDASNCTYTGAALTPKVAVSYNGTALVAGKDYTLSYSNNVNVGTATVTVTYLGAYSGREDYTYSIKAAPITSVELDKTSYAYNGAKLTPVVSVYSGSKKLSSSNYAVSYANNTNVGTATVTVKGTGNYTGTISKKYTISKGTQTITASKKSVAIGKTASLGAKLKTGNGKLTYASSNKSVATISSDGKITAKKIGKTTITITAAATGTYNKATKKVTVTVIPVATKVSGVSSPSVGAIKLSWSKKSGITGYQIQYSLKNDMSDASKKTISSASTGSKKLTGLKQGKKYYVRIRTYKKVNDTTYYSNWSEIKSVTVKENARSKDVKYTLTKDSYKAISLSAKTKFTVTLKASGFEEDYESCYFEIYDEDEYDAIFYCYLDGDGTVTKTITLPAGKYYLNLCTDVSSKVTLSGKMVPKISKSSATVKKGNTTTVSMKGTTGVVTWKSSNTKVATVSSSGKITAKACGTATIYTTVKGTKYSCKVTVPKPATAKKSTTTSKTTSSGGGTVYWVPSGAVYHSTKSCPTLSRSKTIYSGSKSASGKSRACKVCN